MILIDDGDDLIKLAKASAIPELEKASVLFLLGKLTPPV